MRTRMQMAAREGFTLIEVLVTVILLALLVAAAYPVVTQQVSKGDPTRTAEDLVNVSTGLNLFHLDLRKTYPGGLNDLTRLLKTTYKSYNGNTYSVTDSSNWNGPYLDKSIARQTQAGQDTAFATGFGTGVVIDSVLVCKSTAVDNTVCTNLSGSNYIGVKVLGLDSANFMSVDAIIDGGLGTDSARLHGGRLRYESSTTYYLAAPISK